MISSANWAAHYGLYEQFGVSMSGFGDFKVNRKRKWVIKETKEEEEEEEDGLKEKERRVCLGCSASTTPMWRKGPAGKNTLCNACGLRDRRGVVRSVSSRKNNAKKEAMVVNTNTEIVGVAPPSSSSLSSSTSEEMIKRQKELQMMMLRVFRWNKKKVMMMERTGKQEAEAALLLCSLSSASL